MPRALRQLIADRAALFGLAVIALMALAAVLAPVLGRVSPAMASKLLELP